MRRITPTKVLGGTMVIDLIFLAASGRLEPLISLDTASYLYPWTWSEGIWGEMRGPLFGFLLTPFGNNFTLLPTILLGLFFVSIYYLYKNLLDFGVSEYGALALTLPLLLSNALFRYAREVHVEFPAIICMLFSLGIMLKLQDTKARTVFHWLAFAFTCGFAYLIRPSFIPFAIFLPLTFALFGHLYTKRWQLRATAIAFVLSVAPFVIVSTIRYSAVNDFNIVSFGGFNMTGLGGELLTEEMIPKLKPENQEIAKSILQGREAKVRRGELSPLVFDYDKREFSFQRTARGYFDILANNFDEILYKIVLEEQRPDESWVHFNKRLMGLNVDIVRAAPGNYAMYTLGALRSTIGTATVTNFAFVTGFCALLIAYFYLLFFSELPQLQFASVDIPVIVLITLCTAIASGILPILIAYPIIRYVSTSSLFLPSLIFYLTIQLIYQSREPPFQRKTINT